MKNIHLIPTDKPSRFTFIKYYSYYRFRKDEFINNDTHQNQNIYITNSEEIKEGNNYLNGKHLYKADRFYKKAENDKKIILTTDQDLIKDGVQPIDDEFLEWFVENPSCESVKLEVDLSKHNGQFQTKYGWKIITSKEEPEQETLSYTEAAKKDERIFNSTMMKQETLDEVNDNRKNLYFKKQVMNPYAVEEYSYTAYEKGFIEGYEESNKYQQERMYSEEDMKLAFESGYDLNTFEQLEIPNEEREYLSFKEWFEQNKKK
jgi:hypothetical protein